MSPLFELILDGFRGSDSKTDHLILWVRCSSPGWLDGLVGVKERKPMSVEHIPDSDLDAIVSCSADIGKLQQLIDSRCGRPEVPVKMVCNKCGSENVSNDALVRWSVRAQDWQISAVLDNATCEECGNDGSVINEVEIPLSYPFLVDIQTIIGEYSTNQIMIVHAENEKQAVSYALYQVAKCPADLEWNSFVEVVDDGGAMIHRLSTGQELSRERYVQIKDYLAVFEYDESDLLESGNYSSVS